MQDKNKKEKGQKKMSKVVVMDHPLIQHKITILRSKDTPVKEFRALANEIALLMGYESTRDIPLRDIEVETPLTKTMGKEVTKDIAVIPILRAGLGMVDALLSLFPSAKVGHIGLYRDPETHKPVEYYCKLPTEIEERTSIVVDPMLATGGSAVAAIDFLKARGAKNIKFMCLIAAPEGVKVLTEAHPDVDVFIGSLDEKLNDHCYIVPGLGDAGDRIFGTK